MLQDHDMDIVTFYSISILESSSYILSARRRRRRAYIYSDVRPLKVIHIRIKLKVTTANGSKVLAANRTANGVAYAGLMYDNRIES